MKITRGDVIWMKILGTFSPVAGGLLIGDIVAGTIGAVCGAVLAAISAYWIFWRGISNESEV